MKTIVIFGAASAIAQATARLFAQEHSNLILIDRNADQLKIIEQDLATRGATSTKTFAADLTEMDRHEELWKDITKNGLPDVVLIAYGTLGDQKKSEQEFETTHRELITNFVSVVSLLTHIANDFEQDGNARTIAVISSVAGDRGRQSNYIYGTAKGGLTIFLQGLRNRFGKTPINVLTIKPGFVDTPMTASFKKGLLWVKPEVVGQGIYSAIKSHKSVVYLPWFWRYIMLIIRSIPESIFKNMSL